MRSFHLGVLFLAVSVAPLRADDASPTADQIRTAIQRSIPHIEREGWRWIETKKCLSCHMIPFMQWSLYEADLRGIQVDAERLADLDDYVQATAPKIDPDKKPKRGDTAAQIVISRASYRGSSDNATRPWLEKLVVAQDERGYWAPGGQLPSQKRPKRETEEVSTMWVLLALRSVDEAPDQHPVVEAAARKWLSEDSIVKGGSATSTEWFATRLLLELRWGDEASIESTRKALLDLQHSDGGWGWLTKSDSDAIATGTALWALSQCELEENDPAIRRAVRFLLDTQRDDGTWRVESTRAKDKGKVLPTSVYWGTTWAVIGLSQLLPNSNLALRAEHSKPVNNKR